MGELIGAVAVLLVGSGLVWLLSRLGREKPSATVPQILTEAEISAEPDGPLPFGYKTAWLAVRCEDPREVADALKCQCREKANWQSGLLRSMETRGDLFCSPVLDGFVLMIGQGLFALTERQDELEKLAGRFPEVQYFASYRVSSCYCWARYADGVCVRAYGVEDGKVSWDIGPLTPEETALGFDRFPCAGWEDSWEDSCEDFPDEEDVLDIAAAWGVDPRFEKTTCPPSVGWLCAL